MMVSVNTYKMRQGITLYILSAHFPALLQIFILNDTDIRNISRYIFSFSLLFTNSKFFKNITCHAPCPFTVQVL